MEDRLKILEMLSNGIINAEEANELLKSLDDKKVELPNHKIIKESDYVKNSVAKVFHVKVESHDGDTININLPLSFIKAAIKAGTVKEMLNNSVSNSAMNQIDIDLLIAAVNEGLVGDIVQVESKKGDTVHIYID